MRGSRPAEIPGARAPRQQRLTSPTGTGQSRGCRTCTDAQHMRAGPKTLFSCSLGASAGSGVWPTAPARSLRAGGQDGYDGQDGQGLQAGQLGRMGTTGSSRLFCSSSTPRKR
ncbi:unnamed protein product [Calypogeia fissa]